MMNTITPDDLASIEFTLKWNKNGINHEDRLYAYRVNFWRDILPPKFRENVMGAATGDRLAQSYAPGEIVPTSSPRAIHPVVRRNIDGRLNDGTTYTPRYGRFYPRGILHGVSGVFRGNVEPFRCSAVDADGIEADFNHPLADLDLTVEARVADVRAKFEEHGGTLNDWGEQITSGPGMQARCNGHPTDFFASQAFMREDPQDDRIFYRQPRMVQHIDSRAIRTISELYGRLIKPGSRVLDLMSSWTSHLPADLELQAVEGLGMNADELAANERLAGHVVHDLNRDPRLPYADSTYDAAVCTVSVEYLTRPFAVFDEMARVLAPGGIFVVTFSNRWFPPKAIRIWAELHPFERMGLVREFFSRSGRFEDLATFSSQGRPRPEADKYAGQLPFSDPVFAVWGRRV
jgi:SAM-dependent methyltransferase